jgi:hypothetical protein
MRGQFTAKPGSPRAGKQAFLYALGIVAFKAVIFLLDPVPKFFFGDSYCYLETATTGWIPPDRSFTYGYFIKATTLLHNSLWPLMAAQGIMGLGCALGLAYLLQRHLGSKAIWAGLMGILCVLEPIQLHYERAVMSECLSLLLLVLYLMACLRYLEGGGLGSLVVSQLLGALLMSVRLSFLPMVLSFAFVVPLMRAARRENPEMGLGLGMGRPSHRWRRGLVHLLVSMTLTWALHSGYKWCFGKLSGHPPGYAAATGHVLLATWAPVIREGDFPDQTLGKRLLESSVFDPRDRRLRNDQLFSPGGLVHRLRELLPEEAEAEAVARGAALGALRRDPWGVLGLGAQTFMDFFELEYLTKMLKEDLALHQEEEYANFKEVFAQRLLLPDEQAQPMTWTRHYYLLAVPWYWALLLTPLVGIWALLRAPQWERPALALLVLASLFSLGSATVMAVQPVVRYLHPLAWLALALWGSFLGGARGLHRGPEPAG